MTPRNRSIYHCVSCGSVNRLDQTEAPPQCCGTQMVKAAAETVGMDDDDAELSHQPSVPSVHGQHDKEPGE